MPFAKYAYGGGIRNEKLYSITEKYLWVNMMFFVVQIVLMSVMVSFMSEINKTREEQLKNIISVFNPNTSTGNNICLSVDLIQNMMKLFDEHIKVISWSILASFLFNISYVSFARILPQNKWMLAAVYTPIFIMGVICVGLAASNFIKIQGLLSKEPTQCHDYIKKYRAFFITSMAAASAQSALALWVGTSQFINVNE